MRKAATRVPRLTSPDRSRTFAPPMNTPPLPPAGLNLANLTLPKEQTYFAFVLVVSVLVWGLLAVSLIGLAYAAFFAFFLWLGNGLLVARLRSEAVRVDEKQMPELAASFRQVCERLGLPTIPALYVLQAGGTLNAFATRHTGRNFVVVYSDFLESLGADTPEMKFILGHELGHIRSRHILKQIFLAPGLFCPLLGPAYRRSWESSCDRHGAFAANDVDGAVRAMLTLSGGRTQGRTLDPDVFASQHRQERGFFVSLHELVSTYPTLSRRVTDLLALKTGTPAPRPERNPFAYLFGLFIPGGGSAAPANALVLVVIIGLLAAMAIPAFQKVRQTSQLKACLNNQRMLAAGFEQYSLEKKLLPRDLTQIAGPGLPLHSLPLCPGGGNYLLPPGARDSSAIVCTVHGSLEKPNPPSPGRR